MEVWPMVSPSGSQYLMCKVPATGCFKGIRTFRITPVADVSSPPLPRYPSLPTPHFLTSSLSSRDPAML